MTAQPVVAVGERQEMGEHMRGAFLRPGRIGICRSMGLQPFEDRLHPTPCFGTERRRDSVVPLRVEVDPEIPHGNPVRRHLRPILFLFFRATFFSFFGRFVEKLRTPPRQRFARSVIWFGFPFCYCLYIVLRIGSRIHPGIPPGTVAASTSKFETVEGGSAP